MQKIIDQKQNIQQSNNMNEICTSPIGKKQNGQRVEFQGFSQYVNDQNMQLGDAQSLFNRKCWPWAYVVVIQVQELKPSSRLLWFLKLCYPLHQDIWWNPAIWAIKLLEMSHEYLLWIERLYMVAHDHFLRKYDCNASFNFSPASKKLLAKLRLTTKIIWNGLLENYRKDTRPKEGFPNWRPHCKHFNHEFLTDKNLEM